MTKISNKAILLNIENINGERKLEKTIEIVRHTKQGKKPIPNEFHGYILAFCGNFKDVNGNKIQNWDIAPKYNGIVWDHNQSQNVSFEDLDDLKRFAKEIIASDKRNEVLRIPGAIKANAVFPVKYFPTDGKQAEWITKESDIDLLRAI